MEPAYVYVLCAIIVTVMFVIVGIYLIQTLVTLKHSLKALDLMLAKSDERLSTVSRDVVKLIDSHHQLANSLNKRVSQLDPVIDSVADIGSSLQDITHSFSGRSSGFNFFGSAKRKNWQDTVGNLAELAIYSLGAWQKIKKRED